MQRRSLLDYLPDNVAGQEFGPPASGSVSDELELRLAELERRFAAANQDAEVAEDRTFSSQIQDILRRRKAAGRQMQPTDNQPRTYARIAMEAPPLIPDLPLADPDDADEFTKFVEAVHLLGQVADRFMHTPVASRLAPEARHEPIMESDEAIRLALALKEATAEFRAIAAELAGAVSDIRRLSGEQSANGGSVAPADAGRQPEDDELLRLQEEFDRLRERLGAVARARSRERY